LSFQLQKSSIFIRVLNKPRNFVDANHKARAGKKSDYLDKLFSRDYHKHAQKALFLRSGQVRDVFLRVTRLINLILIVWLIANDADLLRNSGFNSMYSYTTINSRSMQSHDEKTLWCKLQTNDEIERAIMLMNYRNKHIYTYFAICKTITCE